MADSIDESGLAATSTGGPAGSLDDRVRATTSPTQSAEHAQPLSRDHVDVEPLDAVLVGCHSHREACFRVSREVLQRHGERGAEIRGGRRDHDAGHAIDDESRRAPPTSVTSAGSPVKPASITAAGMLSPPRLGNTSRSAA